MRNVTSKTRVRYRILSFLTIFMLIWSSIPMVNNYSITVKAVKEVEIRSFSTGLADGAVLTEGKYVWTAPQADAGHLFVYRINYSLSG